MIKIEQPGSGDFMREIGPFVPDTDRGADGRGTRCSGQSRAAGARASPSTCASPRARTSSGASPRPPTWWSRTSGPARSSSGTSRPPDLAPHLVVVRISSFGQDGPEARRPGLDRVGIGFGGLLNLTGYPDRPPVRVGVTISDYLTGVFAAHAATAALYERDTQRSGARCGHRRRSLRRRPPHPRVDAAGLRPSRRRAQPRGEPARELGAARQLPDRRRQVRVHRRRLGRQLLPTLQGDGPRRPARRPPLHPARGPRRAQRRDQRARRRLDRHPPRRRDRAALRRTRRSGRDRVHRGRHLRRPAHRRSRRPGDRRRPGRGSAATAGALSPPGGRSRRSRPPARPRLGEHTREVLGELLGLAAADVDRLEQEGVV